MNKFMSGRWIFTIVSALVFAILSIMGKIDPKDALALITTIAVFYFTRNDRQPPKGV